MTIDESLDKIYGKRYISRFPERLHSVCHECEHKFEDGEEQFCDYLHLDGIHDNQMVNIVCRNCIVSLRKLED